jgi:DNA transformation protein
VQAQTTELSRLANIGPTIERRLNEIGVRNRADLEALGPAEAYRRIAAASSGRAVSVAYLYSLQGALDGLHRDALPMDVKSRLLREIDR